VGKLHFYGDQLFLINFVLTSLPMYILSSFKYLKVSGSGWTFLDQGFFFGKMMAIKESIDLLDGIPFVDLRSGECLGLKF
jgi:hypothetical protein